LNYVIGWAIALLVLGLLNSLIQDVTDAIDAPFFGLAYLPVIFGAFGGLLRAYLTLNKHTAIQKDFDPAHIPWYLFSPLVGGILGFLTYVLITGIVATTVNQSISDASALRDWPFIAWFLAFLAGLYHHRVFGQIRHLRSGNGDNTTPDASLPGA
jgi:hypothetical protein